jgi:hypothetical protein
LDAGPATKTSPVRKDDLVTPPGRRIGCVVYLLDLTVDLFFGEG